MQGWWRCSWTDGDFRVFYTNQVPCWVGARGCGGHCLQPAAARQPLRARAPAARLPHPTTGAA